MLTPADEQAAEGRQAGRLGRPLSDCPGELRDEERGAWRAGGRLGHGDLGSDYGTDAARDRSGPRVAWTAMAVTSFTV